VKLLTDELRARIPALYSQEVEIEPVVYAKFFLPGTGWTWYVTEGSQQEDDYLFFGFVVGLESEFGYFLLSELESARTRLALAWNAILRSAKAGSLTLFPRRSYEPAVLRSRNFLASYFFRRSL
jgi:hypothetical protein